MNLKRLFLDGTKFVGKNLPAVMTVVSIGGLGLTAFLSGKGCLVADQKLKEYTEETGIVPATKMDKVKITYRYFIPAIVAGLGTAACMIIGWRVGVKQLAAMAGMVTTAERLVNENRDAIKEVVGDKGLRKIDEKINEKRFETLYKNKGTIYDTGNGTVLCCEGFLSGTLFRASPEWVHRCVNEFNHRLIEGEDLCYNEFIKLLIPDFDEDCLPQAGYLYTFNIDSRSTLDHNSGLLELVEDSGLVSDTREPYLIFHLSKLPTYDREAYYGM